MLIQFTKMQGLGNDFLVVDTISQPVFFNQAQIRRLADRNFGIGFDQMLLIEPPHHPESDFHFRIFNADGSEAGHCGNGARCVAKYVRRKGLTWKYKTRLSTSTATLEGRLERNGDVTIDMGIPRLEPAEVPLKFAERSVSYHLEAGGSRYHVGAVSMGNPHCVLQIDDIEQAPVDKLGPLLSGHSYFPQQANVGFMQIEDKGTIRLRVYERGVGETLACGSGACAAVVHGRLLGSLDESVKVILPGGALKVTWPGENHGVAMTGPAEFVFEGQFEI